MQALFAALAAFAGLLSAAQAGANAALGKSIGQVPAGLTSFAVSGIAMWGVALVLGQVHWPAPDKMADAPWWGWSSGIMGAVLVSSQLYASQPLGSAVYAAIFVTCSVLMSLVLDHYGLLGFKVHAFSWLRGAGALCLVVGVALVARG